MVKVLAFLEADLPRIAKELNVYMDKFDIAYVWNTGARLIFILKEKPARGRPANKKEE